MANCMQHWNKSHLVAVTCRYTGTILTYHEMYQVCFLALDSNCVPRKDVLPFNMVLKVDYPRRFDVDTSNAKKKEFEHSQTLMTVDPFAALDLFDKWFQKLNIKYTKFGTQKKIMLLGHEMHTTLNWVEKWLDLSYDLYIDRTRSRDTAGAALFLNDYAGMHAETVNYHKTDLSYLRNLCNVEKMKVKDPLAEAAVIANIYKTLCQRGIYR